MRVQPVLGDWTVPRLVVLETLEERDLVELAVPGRPGSLFADLERRPMRILLAGSLFGDEARDEFLAQVRERFQNGEPLTFVADILTATDLQHVLIERLELAERADAPDQLDYLIVCVESPPPPPPPSLLGEIDTGLLDAASGLVDTLGDALAALDALSVPDFGDPTAALSGVLDTTRQAVEGLDAVSGTLDELFGEG
jgi:hypothetical protein